MKYKKNKVDIISMGCAKNLVDSERLLYQLKAKGYETAHNPATPDGEYVVVNTCGFINDAKTESIELILGLAQLRAENKIGNLIVMGCLSQRYIIELPGEIPEVDRWYGKFDWTEFVNSLPDRSGKAETLSWKRSITTPPHSAFLKISEGCDRFCAFCAIPYITGRHHSRPIPEIVEEVKDLVARGVKEFNVIAQDLSSYGVDLYGEHKLAELIETIADIPGVKWIRLHYAYPSDFPLEVLDVMARRDNVCKYMDIALQHISNPVLQNMRRNIDADATRRLLAEMRRRVPDIKIRTTLMVGFPGETEESFQELLDFVDEQRFDRMGAFAYCEEDDTWAARNLVDSIPEDVKQSRLDRLMEKQQEISEELASEMVGQKVELIVDELEGDIRVCRSQWDSPEVDCTYYVYDSTANPGDFITAEITEASIFDFKAKQI